MNKKILLLLLLLPAHAAAQASSIGVAAVDKEGHGVLLGLDVEVRDGKGRILLSSIPFTGIDTQYSEQQAVKFAQNYTGYDFSKKDVIFTFIGNTTSIDGQSAGAAMTTAVISIIEKKKIRADAVLTGTIEPDGRIGKVGGTYAKAFAAAKSGANLFLLPAGQIRQAEAIKRIAITDYGTAGNAIEPYAIDLGEYSAEHWGMGVAEAGNISEALSYLYSEEGEKKEKPEEFEYPLQRHQMDAEEMVLVGMGDRRAAKAEKNIGRLESEDLTTQQTATIAEHVKKAREKLKNAEKYRQYGYAYTYANNAFLAEMETNIARDLVQSWRGETSQDDLLKRSSGQIASLSERLSTRGYGEKNMQWLAAAQQRYTWAHQQMALLKSSLEGEDMENADFFAQYEVIASWLSISEEFLENAHEGNLTFSSRIADLAQERAKSAEKSAYALKLFNIPDPYSSETYLLTSKEELSRGWYIASAYDGIYASGRALASNTKDTAETRQKARDEVLLAERYFNAGGGFWAGEYLKHAKASLSENGTDRASEAYVYANIAKELARYQMEFDGIELKKTGNAPIIIERPGKTEIPKAVLALATAVSVLYLVFSLLISREISGLRKQLGNRKIKEPIRTRNKG